MAGSEFSKSFHRMAKDLEVFGEDLKRLTDEAISGSGANSPRSLETGAFISVKDAIQRSVTAGLEDAVSDSNRRYRKYVPNENPRIQQESIGWMGDSYLHRFFTDNDYVRYHEFGTGKHGRTGSSYTITPNSANALSFEWDKLGGKRVVFQQVQHPGVEGKHEMEKNMRASRYKIRRELSDRIDDLDRADIR